MYIEYACYDYSLSDDEIKNNLNFVAKLGIKNISIFPIYIQSIKSLIDEFDLKISCPVDYPFGISDSKIRSASTLTAIKSGASTIDMVAPAKLITNRKYDKIRDDIKNNITICQDNNTQLRYIIEYRVFNHEILAKISTILKSLNIEYILPSTGYMLDDINDNIIACKYLMAKSQIKTITNANIWTEKHIQNIKLANIYGIRFHNIHSLQLFSKNNYS